MSMNDALNICKLRSIYVMPVCIKRSMLKMVVNPKLEDKNHISFISLLKNEIITIFKEKKHVEQYMKVLFIL